MAGDTRRLLNQLNQALREHVPDPWTTHRVSVACRQCGVLRDIRDSRPCGEHRQADLPDGGLDIIIRTIATEVYEPLTPTEPFPRENL